MAASSRPGPPPTYREFSERHPKVAAAWELLREAEGAAGIDERSRRLVKLGVAIGARSEGSVHSAVRKALAAGVSPDEVRAVVPLCASTVGLPNAVAAFTWIEDILDEN